MTDGQFNRQLDIINPDLLNKRILIIGAGGIGSWTALGLAKMGCKDITVMDFDTVSAQNLNSQNYRRADIGKSKCEALANNLYDNVSNPEDLSKGYFLNTISKAWESGMDIKYEIVISALDSMETRLKLWNDIKINPYVLYYIDGRMGGEFFRVYSLDLRNGTIGLYQKYEKTLVSEDKVDPTPCTEKAVIYNVFGIGSIIGNLVKKVCKGESLPYEYAYDFSNLMRV